MSRVFHAETHTMLLETPWTTQCGTNAGLTTEALRGAPPDWSKKNPQLVLHVKVISDAPNSPGQYRQTP